VLDLSPGNPGNPPGGFQAVAAVSAQDVWAVGATNGDMTWIIHWNGIAWARVPSPNPAGLNVSLVGVAAASPASVWAVGSFTTNASVTDGPVTVTVTDAPSPVIEHWDGRTWTLVPSPAILGGRLTAVSAASPDNAWAVGDLSTGGGLIEHWDGRAWTRAASLPLPGGGGGSLDGVTALSPGSAWAVGTSGSLLCPGEPATGATIIEHWDGRAWTLVPSPAPGMLTAVTATSPDRAWAVGCSRICGDGGTAVIEHWDGKAWTSLSAICASPADPGCLPPSPLPSQ
jgi:hypothetical protein